MTFEVFFQKVSQKAEEKGVLTISIPLLNDLVREITRQNSTGWSQNELKSEDAEGLKELMEEVFMFSCCRLESIDDDPVWKEASRIAVVFCQTLNEVLGTNLALCKILSPCEIAAQAGILEIYKGEDERKCVRLTPKGEKLAKETEKELKPAERQLLQSLIKKGSKEYERQRKKEKPKKQKNP